jgi:hypothetical protein
MTANLRDMHGAQYLEYAGDVDERGVGEAALLDGQHLQLQLANVVRENAQAGVRADVAVLEAQPRDRCGENIVGVKQCLGLYPLSMC